MTLDEKVLRDSPNTFVRATCYLCGAVAARWRGLSPAFRDTACTACEDADEAEYARQGGQ